MKVLKMSLALLLCAPAAAETAWNPLERQEVEADTTFLLDADAEQKLEPGEGGLIPGNASEDKPWQKVVPCEGKFRKGFTCLDKKFGYVWMPSIGVMPAAEFTVEFWLKAAIDCE